MSIRVVGTSDEWRNRNTGNEGWPRKGSRDLISGISPMASSGFISHPITAIKTCRKIVCYCYFWNFFFGFSFWFFNKSVSFYLGNVKEKVKVKIESRLRCSQKYLLVEENCKFLSKTEVRWNLRKVIELFYLGKYFIKIF